MAAPKVSPLAPAQFPDLPSVAGLRLSVAEGGVRYSGRTDLMLATLAPGTAVAGAFTRSATRAAPVLDCEAKIGASSGAGAGFLVNAGNANAFTGVAGTKAVAEITAATAARLGLPPERIFTASTGVIGEPLPADRVTAMLDTLAAGTADWQDAARAIMTTDTFPKGAGRVVETPAGPVAIAGFAKGSGMIAPDMATMLVYIFTDATISQTDLQTLVDRFTPVTFNAITVDSDTSTSDTLLVAATGQGPALTADDTAFAEALYGVMLDLAHQVVRDGEGATKFVEVRITGATTDADAKRIAMSVANSPLVKTAIAGEDPNWGRIVMAVGKSGAAADRDRLTIRLGPHVLAEDGQLAPGYREEDGAAYMKGAELTISVDLGLGSGDFRAWTCDLTHGYVEINADYRS